MDREQLEFRICQYLDGALAAGDCAALEQTLSDDADARSMLAQYRRLQLILDRELVTPNLEWDRLAEQLSSAVAAADETSRAAKPLALPARFGWRAPWVRLSMAASVLLAATATLLVVHHERRASGPLQLEQQPSSIVIVPQPELPTGSPIEQITIGPSPALAAQGGDWRYAQGVVAEPSRAVVVSRADARRDGHPSAPPAH